MHFDTVEARSYPAVRHRRRAVQSTRMCGIVALWSRRDPIDGEVLERATRRLHHRGGGVIAFAKSAAEGATAPFFSPSVQQAPGHPLASRSPAPARVAPCNALPRPSRVRPRAESTRASARQPQTGGCPRSVTVQTRPAQQSVILPHGEPAGRQVPFSSCASSTENRSTNSSTDGSLPVSLHPPFASIFANVVPSVACAASTQAGSGSLPVWIARRKHAFSADDALSAACILATPHATAGSDGAALALAARTMMSAMVLTHRMIEVCIFVSCWVAR